MRRPIIAGNWKMYKTVGEAVKLVEDLKKELSGVKDVEIVVCPPYTALWAVGKVVKGTNIGLGAQDLYWEDEGAYTGEVSPAMLKDVGCQYVIIGHSERRTYFDETNEAVNNKVKAALKHGLTPVVCVGEKLTEREEGKTFHVVEDHVRGVLSDLSAEEAGRAVIAYEPVWAIGTGKTATPAQAEEVHKFIRGLLSKIYSDKLASMVRIQYGGSVKPENIKELMAEEDIDGALVGGASLKADSFAKIVKFK
jgi:triosephosphate isomerase